MLVLRKLDSKHFDEFKSTYYALSEFNIADTYLEQNEVYGFYQFDKMIGGFILGKSFPYRTLNVFCTNAENGLIDTNKIDLSKEIIEICCFWVNIKYRKSKWIISAIWMIIAWKVFVNYKYSIVLFGTKVLGLAKMYYFPRGIKLINIEKINKDLNFIFISERFQFLFSVLWIVVNRIVFNKIPDRLSAELVLRKNNN